MESAEYRSGTRGVGAHAAGLKNIFQAVFHKLGWRTFFFGIFFFFSNFAILGFLLLTVSYILVSLAFDVCRTTDDMCCEG